MGNRFHAQIHTTAHTFAQLHFVYWIHTSIRSVMFKNYLTIAIRNLWKNKSYIIINIFGLGISLACCVAAYLVLASYNIEFDMFSIKL